MLPFHHLLLSLLLPRLTTNPINPSSPSHSHHQYPVPRLYTPNTTSPDVLESFTSLSIELSSFPSYAGNLSHPNYFSKTLLTNLAHLSGSPPYIRVGGNTQDYALYSPSLTVALNGTINPARSPDYPTSLTIGPSFFESYLTLGDNIRYTHGLNFGLGGNISHHPQAWISLLETVGLVCDVLTKGNGTKLYMWQYGNEPDLYSTSAQGPVRSREEWDEVRYVRDWRNGTAAIERVVRERCPELGGGRGRYLGPDFGGVGNRLSARKAWEVGLNEGGEIGLFSTHKFISGAATPGVTLQHTLLNHTVTKRSVDAHVVEYDAIRAKDPSVPPLVFGEANSLYNQGRPGLSNTFGAALWGVDFQLYSASVGFKRVHMHQGTNYRYAAWQPVETEIATKGTKAPYYAAVFVAAALGDLVRRSARVLSLSPDGSTAGSEHEAVYGVYTHAGSVLARLVVVNMRGYNTTVSGDGLEPYPPSDVPERPVREYTFQMDWWGDCDRKIAVRRLMANGSDAITGISYDGWTYDWEADEGRPVRLGNVTVGETVEVHGGLVSVKVPDSSAVLLDFEG
ncbi:family 79 putative glycoside hydrolase [Echria macrotheca]|uniref:Family 79 putative glycoside hydrolase n=1 Tax=Echria macrotheca TaxID=438768 RepID=A0AAJ0B7A5_9PEZI|nr:family 79 putative glycoside hydrolase [Echria macrotheca]